MLPTLWRFVRRSPRIAVAVALGASLLGLLWLGSRPAPSGRAAGTGPVTGEGRLLTPEVELRGVVRQLQEDNAVLRKSLEDVTRTLQEMKDRKPSGPDGALSAEGDRAPAAGARPAATASAGFRGLRLAAASAGAAGRGAACP